MIDFCEQDNDISSFVIPVPHLGNRIFNQPNNSHPFKNDSVPENGAVHFYEMPITPYETRRSHNAEDRNLNFNIAFIFYKYFDY
jgi:hypothetical protein